MKKLTLHPQARETPLTNSKYNKKAVLTSDAVAGNVKLMDKFMKQHASYQIIFPVSAKDLKRYFRYICIFPIFKYYCRAGQRELGLFLLEGTFTPASHLLLVQT